MASARVGPPQTILEWARQNFALIEKMSSRESSNVVMSPSDENIAAFARINELFREIVKNARDKGVDFKKNPNKSFRREARDMRGLENRDVIEALNRAISIKGIVGETGDASSIAAGHKMMTGSYRGILKRFWTCSIEMCKAHPEIVNVKVFESSSFPSPETAEGRLLAVTLVHALPGSREEHD